MISSRRVAFILRALGLYDVVVENASGQKWQPAPSNFASCREKYSGQSMFCKRPYLKDLKIKEAVEGA